MKQTTKKSEDFKEAILFVQCKMPYKEWPEKIKKAFLKDCAGKTFLQVCDLIKLLKSCGYTFTEITKIIGKNDWARVYDVKYKPHVTTTQKR